MTKNKQNRARIVLSAKHVNCEKGKVKVNVSIISTSEQTCSVFSWHFKANIGLISQQRRYQHLHYWKANTQKAVHQLFYQHSKFSFKRRREWHCQIMKPIPSTTRKRKPNSVMFHVQRLSLNKTRKSSFIKS